MNTMTPVSATPSASAPNEVRAYRMGFAVAVVEMAERIGLVDDLNTHLPWDSRQCKVSPGLRLLGLIVAVMVDPRALYRLEAWYAEYDVAVLFGEGRHAEDFNDDAIGRALLKLFEAQRLIIYTGLCAQAVQRLALPPTETVH